MISAKQVKQILDYSFSGGNGFLIPEATLFISPSQYTNNAIPGGVSITGTITPNDGTSINWVLRDDNNSTPIASGSGNAVSHNLVSVPTDINNYSYSLIVNYKDANQVIKSFTQSVTLVVSSPALIGQLQNPSDDILVPGDLTAGIEGTLSIKTQNQIINLFSLSAVNVGRVLFVIPDSYGSVTDIADNTDNSVIDQFDVIADAPNQRSIFITKNTLVPGTYFFKIIF
jgi:hypothetical protein